MLIHDLKINPKYFDDAANGTKSFEIRKNDRLYCVGDTLHLRECEIVFPDGYNGEERYTGREVFVDVTYIFEGPGYGLRKEYCVLGTANPRHHAERMIPDDT